MRASIPEVRRRLSSSSRSGERASDCSAPSSLGQFSPTSFSASSAGRWRDPRNLAAVHDSACGSRAGADRARSTLGSAPRGHVFAREGLWDQLWDLEDSAMSDCSIHQRPRHTLHFTPRFARPRGRSQCTVSVHSIQTTSALTRFPHLEGSASSHRPRGATRGQEGRSGRRTRRTPPTHTSHPQGTNAARLHRRQSSPPPQYIHSVQSSHGTLAGSPPPVHPLSTIQGYNHLYSRCRTSG